jgi:hypothetical protein
LLVLALSAQSVRDAGHRPVVLFVTPACNFIMGPAGLHSLGLRRYFLGLRMARCWRNLAADGMRPPRLWRRWAWASLAGSVCGCRAYLTMLTLAFAKSPGPSSTSGTVYRQAMA